MKEESPVPFRIICMVKFVPDMDGFSYNAEQEQIQRNYVKMILNPDDACSVAFALKVKELHPSTHIEVVTMAPSSVRPHMLDLLRLKIDAGVMITDPTFAGSDTYATTTILQRFLKDRPYDCILTGTRSLDGATSHVPAQLAEALGLDHMQDITHIDTQKSDLKRMVFQVEDDTDIYTYEMMMPGILSLTRESGYKLPYVAYEDFNKDVSDRLSLITNKELQCDLAEIGLKGSLTQVVETYSTEQQKRTKKIVHTDEAGIDFVYSFLRKQGYV